MFGIAGTWRGGRRRRGRAVAPGYDQKERNGGVE